MPVQIHFRTSSRCGSLWACLNPHRHQGWLEGRRGVVQNCDQNGQQCNGPHIRHRLRPVDTKFSRRTLKIELIPSLSVLENFIFEQAQVSETFEVWSKINVNHQFWKKDFYMNTLFKFVRVVLVKEIQGMIERTCVFLSDG